MGHVISISLSDRAFQMVCAQQNGSPLNIDKAEELLLEEGTSFDSVFNESNTGALSKAINAFKNDLKVEKSTLFFTLPFNLAYTKNVIYPTGETNDDLKGQIEWELSQNIPGKTTDYKISLLYCTKRSDSISEATVVAIRKNLLRQLKKIADACDSKISGVLLNCFSIENYLQEELSIKPDANVIVIKLGDFYIEHHAYFSGTYYSSYIDSIAAQDDAQRQQNISEITRERYKQISQLVDQVPFTTTKDISLLVFGSALQNSDYETIVSGISSPVSKIRLNALPGGQAYKYLEAYGSIL